MSKKRRGQSAAFMRSINPMLKKSYSTKRGNNKVARRTRRTRRMSRRSGGASSMSAIKVLLGAGVYGAVREKISTALIPITNKVPLGNISDEVLLFGAGYLANRYVKNPMLKSVAVACMTVEAARMGEAAIKGQIGLGVNNSSSTSSDGTTILSVGN